MIKTEPNLIRFHLIPWVQTYQISYRAIAPDLRGYGDTDAPSSASSYTPLHIVGDLVGLLDALAVDRVFLVGHDWGAAMAWYFCLLKPDRVKALYEVWYMVIA
jgi:pimeloyl-ACP methyl ester carboxylesterase